MLIYNILAEGSLAGAGKAVALAGWVNSADKEGDKSFRVAAENNIRKRSTKGFYQEKTGKTERHAVCEEIKQVTHLMASVFTSRLGHFAKLEKLAPASPESFHRLDSWTGHAHPRIQHTS